MVATANENIRDALVRHQVNLQRLSAGLSQEAISILDRTEASIAADIRKALDAGATTSSTAGLRKLERLESAVRAIRTSAISDITGNLTDSAIDLVAHEAEFTASTLDTNSPTVLDLTLPSAATLTALVTTDPFEGQLLKTWMDRLAESDATAIMDGVKVGLTRGLATDDIVRGVVGSTSLDGADGATSLTRNKITSLVRTAINAYSNSARSATIQANSDVVAFERYTATLDSHTTIICASLDGTVYPVGEGRFPPQHFGCRSIRVAALSPDAVGSRPMKASTEKEILARFNAKEGLSAATRADLPRGMKGEFDAFARAEVRAMTGVVPASTDYSAFLKGQSVAFQNEVLGATKAQLFRDGGLALSKFVTRSGAELNLGQLVARNRAAFTAAGLDPTKYR